MNARLQRPAIYGTRSYKSACFSQESFFFNKKNLCKSGSCYSKVDNSLKINNFNFNH